MRTAVLSLALSLAWMTTAIAADPLAGERWRHRVLLLFAPAAADPALLAQRRILAPSGSEMAERDLRIIEILGDSAPDGLAAAALRRRFGAGDRFLMVLLGKDGGVKLRENEPIAAGRLFAVIDGMPMRQNEMGRTR